MSIIELNSKAAELREINGMIEELAAQAEAIREQFKAALVERGEESLSGNGWKCSWKNVQSSRFDSAAFKADHADLYEQYSKQITGTCFLFA